MHLTRPCALRAFASYVPYSLDLSTRRALRALFVRLKIFLGWICSPTETFHFSRNIKDTTNCAVFMCLEACKAGKIFWHI